MFRLVRTVAVVAVGLLLTAPAPAADPKVKEGDPFPVVALPATQADKVKADAKAVSIADLKGKLVVVVFYPKANTGG